MSKETNTPRTDAIQFQPPPISLSIENEMLRSLSRQLERELAASQAEVERLTKLTEDCLNEQEDLTRFEEVKIKPDRTPSLESLKEIIDDMEIAN